MRAETFVLRVAEQRIRDLETVDVADMIQYAGKTGMDVVAVQLATRSKSSYTDRGMNLVTR